MAPGNAQLKLDKRIKTALDETRLLILGSQVLFGFLLESFFQNAFETLPRSSQLLVCVALTLMVLSIACLIAPSMQHRIVEAGQSTLRLERATSRFAAWGLLPFIASLGLTLYIVFDRVYGGLAGTAVGIASGVLAGFLWFGLAGLIGKHKRQIMTEAPAETPLSTKIEQMLTEARVIIPGGQALLGFQFVATLTKAFAQLPGSVQMVHCAGLCAVALAVLVLMTPAAVHRIAFHGEDDEDFFRIGSRLVMAAPLPLAVGIAADVFVVYYKVSESSTAAVSAGILALLVLLWFWYGYPLWRSRSVTERQPRRAAAG